MSLSPQHSPGRYRRYYCDAPISQMGTSLGSGAMTWDHTQAVSGDPGFLPWRIPEGHVLLLPSLGSLCPLPLLQGAMMSLPSGPPERVERETCPARGNLQGLEQKHHFRCSHHQIRAPGYRANRRSRKPRIFSPGDPSLQVGKLTPWRGKVLAQDQAADNDNDLQDGKFAHSSDVHEERACPTHGPQTARSPGCL